MSLLDLLTAGNIEAFNETRGERARVDLFAADLAGKNLRGADLSGADVDKADLTEADLTDAGLYKARLNGIDGTRAKLVDCLGARVKLREAWLEEADLSGSDFANGDLSEAVLNRSVATGLRLSAGKLKDAELKDARWADCDLAGVHLTRADFTGTDLSRVDLTEAVGGEVVFEKARLEAALFSRCRLPEAKLVGASLVGAKLDGADLAGADFTGADLTGTDFTGANLSGAILTGATLTGAVLAEASLDGVELTGLDLTDVDLTGLDADLLNLSEAQRDAVLTVGIPVNPDARLKPTKVSSARSGDLVAGVWENDDGEGLTTLRWFAVTKEGVNNGILPVTPQSVLDQAAVGVEGGVRVVLHRERPGGITLDTYLIGPGGRLVGSSSDPLGYPAMVSPVLVPDGASFRMYGLARRGPTLVISGTTDEGFGIVGSKPTPTARGFLGRHQPFLACKGNALMPCTRTGVGKPHRSPEGFPGKLATVASDGERWLAVWVDPPAGKNKGGIRAAWLVDRGSPEILPVTGNGAVLSLALAPGADGLWLTWIELEGLGETRVHVMKVGDLPVDLPIQDVDRVAFARGPSAELALVLTTDDERILVTDTSGVPLGELTD